MKPSYIKFFLIALLFVYIPVEANQHQDFDIFLAASADFWQGGNMYQHSYESGFHFFYSPLFALLLGPFTVFPVYASRIIWLALNIAAFFRCFQLLKRFLIFDFFSERQKRWFDLISVLFSLKLILDNFHNGQVTVFMLLLMLEGLRLINAQKPLWGAGMIALGINIKFLPLVLLPYLFYNKQLKACTLVLMWYVIFLLAPALVFGFEHNNQLVHSWLGNANPANQQHLIDTDETTLNGLTTLIPTLLMDKVPDAHALLLRRNIINIDERTVILIINTVRVLLLFFVIYFLRRNLFTRPQNKLKELWEQAYLFLLIPLLFPHQQHYAFFLLMPASIYVIYYVFSLKINSVKPPVFVWVMMSLIYLLTNAHLLLGEFRAYYDHYKIITYGALLLLVLLAYLKPEKLVEKSKIN